MRKFFRRSALLFFPLLLGSVLLALPAEAKLSPQAAERAWDRISRAAGVERVPIHYDGDEAPNAYVRSEQGGGFSLHVTQGLLNVLSSEDEIAGVLGHEAGHIVRGHFRKGSARGMGWQVLSALLGRSSRGVQTLGRVGIALAESGFSREQEVEADDFGVDTAVRAGYSPWGLHSAMKSMKDHGFVTKANAFHSHPPTTRRLKHLMDRADRRAEERGIARPKN